MLSLEELKRLKPEEAREYLRQQKGIRGREDLLYLCRNILGYSEIEEEVHRGFVTVLTKKSRKKLTMMPRGTFKTTIGTIGRSIHKLLNDGNCRILLDSEVLDNSEKFLSQIKDHLRSPLFRELYGDLISREQKETSRELTLTTRKATNLKEPSLFATGIGTVNVGMHYDLIIADDLHSEKNVATKDQIDKVIAHYRLLLSLLEPDGEICIIGTRWHFYDLYSYILEEELGWDVFIEQAIRKDGSLFFPNRLTMEFLEEQRRSQGGYLFSCLYLNNPVSEETQVFRKENFKYWGAESDDYPRDGEKRRLLNIGIMIDRAFSTKAQADFTGIICAGIAPTSEIYVLEAIRKKCGLQELFNEVARLRKKYDVRKVCLETINWEEAYQFFQEQMRKTNQFFILERLIPSGRMSKQGRIETALQARYSSGAVWHKKRMVDLEDELLRFPVGGHDDLIDALSYFPTVMLQPSDPAYERDDLDYEPSGLFGKVCY